MRIARVHVICGGLVIAVTAAAVAGLFEPLRSLNATVEQERERFMALKTALVQRLIPSHGYRCCLNEPCTSCIEETPDHGEGASCDCLSDLVHGAAPCGQCIGGILEGEGNPYLAQYFVHALAQAVGQQHQDTLRMILKAKYGDRVDPVRRVPGPS
jgi:hypothetical protein